MYSGEQMPTSPAALHRRNSPAFGLLRVAANFRTEPAQLNQTERDEIEAMVAKDAALRELALATLARSGSNLVEDLRQDRNIARSYVQLSADIKIYGARLRMLADLMHLTSSRLDIAMCFHPDMMALIDERAAATRGKAVRCG